jgi:uncharacterized RDD family membrane protein YckC
MSEAEAVTQREQASSNPFSAPESDLSPERFPEEADGIVFATFAQRFAAAFVDGIILNVLGVGAGIAVGIIGASLAGTDLEGTIILSEEEASTINNVASTVFAVVWWLYCALQESSAAQATLGKRAVGLSVTDLSGGRISFGRATGRHFGKWLSFILVGAGYLMQPFTAKKQALHDILAGTLVVKV